MIDYKGKEKDFRVTKEGENVIVYTHTHILACTCACALFFFLIEGEKKKLEKGIERQREVYQERKTWGGCGEKDKGGFPGGPLVKNLPAVQETRVQSLVWEGPTCRVATKSVHHNH